MAKIRPDDAPPEDNDLDQPAGQEEETPRPAVEKKRPKTASDKITKAPPAKPAKPAAKAPRLDAADGVQAEPPAKAKKKPKLETGIATKPGLFARFSKAAPTGVWGIDLGQCALKAIRLEIIDGEVTATAFDYVEHPKILSQPDADPDELTREALAKFLSRNTLRGDSVAISVPGQSGLARFVKLPPVEEKKIPDIVKFEAKQQIPFNLDEVVWDYQKLGVGELAAGFVETEIGLFAIKRDMVNRHLQHFKDVGVEVHLVQMAPLALCNFVAYDLLGKEAGVVADDESKGGKKRCITALDIGADSSNLVITDGARIIWQRPIPLGGNHFTRALTKDLKLTFAKAEHLKRNAVKSPDLKKILASLKPVLTDFVGEVQRSLGYFTNTHRDAQIEYMVGLGNAFRLPGLQRFLGEKLQMDVRKLAKMERLTGDAVVASATYTENILSFAAAYGLALQGLKKTHLQTNLLPGEIRAERAVRGKKPWAAAAAALLMVGLGALGFSYYLGYEAYGAPVVQDAEKKATAESTLAAAADTKFDAAKKAALDEEAAVRSIIAGQAERKNWLALTRFVFGEAVPKPDGTNLPDAARPKYWDGKGKVMSGKMAYEDLKNRQEGKGSSGAHEAAPPADAPAVGPTGAAGAKAAPVEDLPAGIDDLIQFNIEFFDQRYADDLGEVWKQIKDKNHLFSADDPNALQNYVKSADPTKPPEGKGWVVELHGYTYHNEARTFIPETLMENINRLSTVKASAADQPAAPGVPAAPAAAPKAGPPSDKDAYLNHISHVVLFDSNDGSRPSIVGQTVLDALVKAAAGPGDAATGGSSGGMPAVAPPPVPMGSGGGAPGAAAPASRDAWRPLSPFMGGGLAGNQNTPAPFTTTAPDAARPRPAATPSGHTRTEFVVLFLWKEPTPSDALRGETDAPKTGTGTSPAAPFPTSAGSMPTPMPRPSGS